MRILATSLIAFFLAVSIPTALLAAPSNQTLEHNGLTLLSGSVAGTVAITGIANHPTFRKWQIDLQLNGDPDQTTFVAVSDTPQLVLGPLLQLDTTRYPNGSHRLRLRVVHSNLNYDEYFATIAIDNPNAPPAQTNGQTSPTVSPAIVANSPLGEGVPEGERRIEVDLSDQTLIAWQGDTIVLQTTVSTGRAEYPTVIGTWPIRVKYVTTRMIGPGYDTPDVPWTMYFFRGYAIHGAYWHNNFGTPVSHGCVNMRPVEAKLLFAWASEGTPVTVHE